MFKKIFKHITLIIFISFPIYSNAFPNYKEQDKQLHFVTSYALTSTIGLMTKSTTIGIASTFTLGLLKEIIQYKKGDSEDDMIANMLGIASAALVLRLSFWYNNLNN